MKANIIIVISIILLTIGFAGAYPSIKVLPDMGGDTIYVPVGEDAYTSIGLEIEWLGWSCTQIVPCYYSAQIVGTGSQGTTYNEWNPPNGQSTVANWQVPVHWTPSSDMTRTYDLYANGQWKSHMTAIKNQ